MLLFLLTNAFHSRLFIIIIDICVCVCVWMLFEFVRIARLCLLMVHMEHFNIVYIMINEEDKRSI